MTDTTLLPHYSHNLLRAQSQFTAGPTVSLMLSDGGNDTTFIQVYKLLKYIQDYLLGPFAGDDQDLPNLNEQTLYTPNNSGWWFS